MSSEPFRRFEALRHARRLLLDGGVALRKHAKERMAKRGLTVVIAFRGDLVGEPAELVIVTAWRKP